MSVENNSGKGPKRVGFEAVLANLKKMSSGGKIEIENINMENKVDRDLALRLALRKAKVNDYMEIVDDLYLEGSTADDEIRQKMIDLAGEIMAIGEDLHNIDWSERD